MTHPQHARRPRRSLAALLLLATAACTDRAVAPPAPDLALTAGAPEMTVVRDPDIFCPFGCNEIAAGDSMQYVVRFAAPRDRERFRERAQWSSADPSIATVSPAGMVTGRAPGEVAITATVGTRSASAIVTIGRANIARVVLQAPTTVLEPRGSVQLKATAIDVLGKEVPDAPLFWFSATPNVVTVDETGLATATGPGDGIVMVFAEFGRSAWVSLHVNGTGTAPALPVASVDVGGTQGCAAGPSGEGSCWGWNYYGQLGDGTVAPPDETFPLPQRVIGGEPFVAFAAADFHTCALTAAGAAWCWGYGFDGQLGDGTFGGGSPSPVRVRSDVAFASLQSGSDHSCALDAQGVARCWGANYYGQLGTGSFRAESLPTALATSARFASIHPGLWHSCALGTDGAAWCWGSNDFGQVGNGKIGGGSLVPSKVATRVRFASMDSRVSHACGLTSAGEAWCWGRNDFGMLGDGTTESAAKPVRVATAARFTTIATGTFHTCALGSDGRAWCWGNNEWGQLGDNGLTSRGNPAPVHGDVRFTSLSAGNNVTCGTTASGEAWCWGSSHFGMLGNGQSGWDTISPVPVRVTGGKR